MVRWEWNVVKVALELGSNSAGVPDNGVSRVLPDMIWTVCLDIIFSLVFGNDCQARIRWQNLGLQFVWVQTGVLGRKRLGPWAMLLGQNSRPKWI